MREDLARDFRVSDSAGFNPNPRGLFVTKGTRQLVVMMACLLLLGAVVTMPITASYAKSVAPAWLVDEYVSTRVDVSRGFGDENRYQHVLTRRSDSIDMTCTAVCAICLWVALALGGALAESCKPPKATS